ncbi:MAG TPA: DUF3300 domain-containing protein [Verrucomicrobiae bacterium]|nr:DUF3300 domain-containing protein [Verrucomicrobiae bacterium]
MKTLFNIVFLLFVFAGTALSLRAQVAVPPPMPLYQPLGDDPLDQLLGPIALYPDPLIAQILPASTFPTQIVLADRYVSGGGDPNQIDQQPWDASVQALARYPNILQWMDQNLDWTTELGQAFLNQPQDVMNSIQRLRTSAYNLSNLQSTPQQQVIDDGGYIQIVPVNPQVIYVPVYQPAVVYYQSASITFGVGFTIGAWLDGDVDWGNHHIIVWHRDHPRPPNWWHAPPRQRDTGHATVWRPDHPPGAGEAYRGDRGWAAPNNQPVVGVVGRSVSDSVMPRRTPAPAVRPGIPAVAQHPAPAVNFNQRQPESNGAFIGVQNANDTRAYSNRGRQSLQTVTPSAPAHHSAPAQRPARPSGSGGGGNSSHSQQRH